MSTNLLQQLQGSTSATAQSSSLGSLGPVMANRFLKLAEQYDQPKPVQPGTAPQLFERPRPPLAEVLQKPGSVVVHSSEWSIVEATVSEYPLFPKYAHLYNQGRGREIFADPNVRAEAADWSRCGVINALEMVLRFGVFECRKKRKWALRIQNKQKDSNPIKNLGSLLCKSMFKGSN